MKLSRFLIVIIISVFFNSCQNKANSKLDEVLTITGHTFQGSAQVGMAYGESTITIENDNLTVSYSVMGQSMTESGKLKNLEITETGPDDTYEITGLWDNNDAGDGQFYFRVFEDVSPNTVLCQVSSKGGNWSYFDNFLMKNDAYLKVKKILKQPKKSIKQKLQGVWKSLDDDNSYMEFDDNQIKSGYFTNGSIEWESESYCLSNGCKCDKSQSENNKYIYSSESNTCLYIEDVNALELTLSNTTRGNTLKYKRLKN